MPSRTQKSTGMMYTPDSLWTWSFFGVALIQAFIVLALEAYALAVFQQQVAVTVYSQVDSAYTRTVPVTATIYLFGMLYFLILVWDSLRMRNTIQVIGLCLANLSLMAFGAAEPKQVQDAIQRLGLDPSTYDKLTPVEIAIPCILFGGTIVLSLIARQLYNEFAWSIYKHISADLRMKQRYMTYQIYIALMKFDFYFFLGFAVQLLIVLQTFDAEFWLTIAAVPIVIFVLLMSGYWVRRENLPGMVIVIIIYIAGLVYYFFKLVRIWSGDKAITVYQPINKELTIFAVITLLLIMGTIVNAVQCVMNFGKGLKPYLLSRRDVGETEKSYNTEMPSLPHSQAPPARMTID